MYCTAQRTWWRWYPRIWKRPSSSTARFRAICLNWSVIGVINQIDLLNQSTSGLI